MTRILFICHGNICRSTMAQFVFEELARRAGRADEFVVDSAATSREEIGNPPHHGTVAKLREVGIPVRRHRARQITRAEYGEWDHIVYMDEENSWGLERILHGDPDGKVSRLLDWTDSPHDVADPWYTGTSTRPTKTCSRGARHFSPSCRSRGGGRAARVGRRSVATARGGGRFSASPL